MTEATFYWASDWRNDDWRKLEYQQETLIFADKLGGTVANVIAVGLYERVVSDAQIQLSMQLKILTPEGLEGTASVRPRGRRAWSGAPWV